MRCKDEPYTHDENRETHDNTLHAPRSPRAVPDPCTHVRTLATAQKGTAAKHELMRHEQTTDFNIEKVEQRTINHAQFDRCESCSKHERRLRSVAKKDTGDGENNMCRYPNSSANMYSEIMNTRALKVCCFMFSFSKIRNHDFSVLRSLLLFVLSANTKFETLSLSILEYLLLLSLITSSNFESMDFSIPQNLLDSHFPKRVQIVIQSPLCFSLHIQQDPIANIINIMNRQQKVDFTDRISRASIWDLRGVHGWLWMEDIEVFIYLRIQCSWLPSRFHIRYTSFNVARSEQNLSFATLGINSFDCIQRIRKVAAMLRRRHHGHDTWTYVYDSWVCHQPSGIGVKPSRDLNFHWILATFWHCLTQSEVIWRGSSSWRGGSAAKTVSSSLCGLGNLCEVPHSRKTQSSKNTALR